jgi:hypothetical protein
MTFTFKNGRFSFVDESGAGWQNFSFELNGVRSDSLPTVSENLSETGGTVVLGGDGVEQELTFTVDDKRKSLIVSRVLKNTGSAPLAITSMSDGLLDPSGAVSLGMELTAIDNFRVRYFHSSNVRTEKFPRFRVEHPYVRCIPYDAVHFNHDEANHLPAFGICDADYQVVLVEGDLNQVKFERSWELGLERHDETANSNGIPRTCRGIQRHTLTEGYVVAPGESVELSRVFYQIKNKCTPNVAFADYVDVLSTQHTFRGHSSPMRHAGVYCTWNYGTFGNITEEIILKRAKVLAENIPNCTHFLIDDGYQALRETYDNRNAGIDSFYPVPSEGYDKVKFPNGMKVIADGIRELGLNPCIWLSPKVYLASPLAQEKPHWLLRDKNGSAELIGKSSFLDLSNPEAREYYLKVLDALFVEWGFTGVKYDFMTQWFLLEQSRFQYNSGIQWRDFAFSEIRKRIGDDGFFMTCIAFSAGNPFPGLNADSYRCGFDIHDGTWHEQVRACSGTLPQLLIEGKKTLLLNMDSAGFSEIPENEQRFRFTWNFITQGILEIGGKLENHTEAQFEMFNRLLANADRGNQVTCLDEKAFCGEPLPEILQVHYPQDSRMRKAGVQQHLAFFNWSQDPKCLCLAIDKAQIDRRSLITDFWSDGRIELHDDFIHVILAPHSAKLLTIEK